MSNLVALPPGRWFHPSEFSCRDGTPYPEALRDEWLDLVMLCDAIRDLWGAPLRVVSGYRTEAYNRKIAGKSHGVASGSFHVKGMAADLAPIPHTKTPLLHGDVLNAYKLGKLPLLGGLGRYPQWVHVDCGIAADGHLRRWSGK